ncbi:MAG: hypothetical protein EBT13_05835 [Rhodobacteraceae bacterium]|nr:hypothetical protein [Paracoccaceae bacterium]
MLAVLFMALEGSMLGLLSWIMKPMFDDVFVQGQSTALWPVGLAILVVFLVRAISSVAQKVFITRINERAAAGIRANLLRHLLGLDSAFHQTHPPGQLIERVTSTSDISCCKNSSAFLSSREATSFLPSALSQSA